eukprot:gene3599-6191_t
MPVIEGNEKRSIPVKLVDTDRETYTLRNCNECHVQISFVLPPGHDQSKAINAWSKKPKAARHTQLVLFEHCTRTQVSEEFSIATTMAFYDCKDSIVELNSCNELDLYQCSNMQVTAPTVKTIRVFNCHGVVIACHQDCHVISVANVLEPAITRSIPDEEKASSISTFVTLDDMSKIDTQRYA